MEQILLLRNAIREYKPVNGQEEKDRALLLDALDEKDVFTRENKARHFTASSWIVNSKRDRVLMIYHNIYNSWSWTGGHADGEQDLLSVALREAKEETGVKHIRPVSDKPFSLEILTVDGHVKRGEYVPSHLHLNVTYLFEADDRDELFSKPDENSGVKWFSPNDVPDACSEPWMVKYVYSKLNDKLKKAEGV